MALRETKAAEHLTDTLIFTLHPGKSLKEALSNTLAGEGRRHARTNPDGLRHMIEAAVRLTPTSHQIDRFPHIHVSCCSGFHMASDHRAALYSALLPGLGHLLAGGTKPPCSMGSSPFSSSFLAWGWGAYPVEPQRCSSSCSWHCPGGRYRVTTPHWYRPHPVSTSREPPGKPGRKGMTHPVSRLLFLVSATNDAIIIAEEPRLSCTVSHRNWTERPAS